MTVQGFLLVAFDSWAAICVTVKQCFPSIVLDTVIRGSNLIITVESPCRTSKEKVDMTLHFKFFVFPFVTMKEKTYFMNKFL